VPKPESSGRPSRELLLAATLPPPIDQLSQLEAWSRWNRSYGPWFRVRLGCAGAGDRKRVEEEEAPAEPWPEPPGEWS
jgi:hypothetical protein